MDISGSKKTLQMVNNEEKEILNDFIALKNGAAVEFDTMSEHLFNWVKKADKNIKGNQL